MKILVTGGAGFIGSNLSRLAIARGHRVRILDDLSTGYLTNVEGLDAEFIHGSILDAAVLAEAVSGVDSIVHLAALGSVPRSIAHPARTHATNATGTLQLLEAARRDGIAHIVFSSSSSVYGKNSTSPKSERNWVRPISPYAVSKLAAEQYTLAYQDSYAMSTLAFRFFNVYGPGQRAGHAYAAVVPTFIDSLLRGVPLPINGDGLNSRDFTYVGTVCRVLLDAVERHVTHSEPVNLAFGTNTAVLELAEHLGTLSGRAVELEYRPPRAGDVRSSQADNAVLRALFPDVVPTGLREGLAHTLAWFDQDHSAARGG